MSDDRLATALGILLPIWSDGDRWAGNPDMPLAVNDLAELGTVWRQAKQGPIPPDLRWLICMAVSEQELETLLSLRSRWLGIAWLGAGSTMPLAISSFERVGAGHDLSRQIPDEKDEGGLAWSWLISLSQSEAHSLLRRRVSGS